VDVSVILSFCLGDKGNAGEDGAEGQRHRGYAHENESIQEGGQILSAQGQLPHLGLYDANGFGDLVLK
jgi:hypothetical protein